MPWEWPVGALCAFLLALATTPAGVSGAVLLLPIQLSILHVPSPAITPTNLLFNVAAVPGGLLRFWHERRLLNHLTWLLVAGTLPGVVAGAVIRVELLSGGRAFQLVAAGVLLPLGLWLALGSQRLQPTRPTPTRRRRSGIWALSLVVGTVGGIYGIGGGSILAPILLALGYSAFEVAPATLAATFLTSIGGIVTYQVLQATHGGAIAPDWALGAFLGAGGFAGSYLGARLQRHLPERTLLVGYRDGRGEARAGGACGSCGRAPVPGAVPRPGARGGAGGDDRLAVRGRGAATGRSGRASGRAGGDRGVRRSARRATGRTPGIYGSC